MRTAAKLLPVGMQNRDKKKFKSFVVFNAVGLQKKNIQCTTFVGPSCVDLMVCFVIKHIHKAL